MVQRHCLTDEQWDLIADLVEAEPKATGRPPKDRHTIVNGIFWILRTGAPWRDLPKRFGKWQTVYDHFNKSSPVSCRNRLSYRSSGVQARNWMRPVFGVGVSIVGGKFALMRGCRFFVPISSLWRMVSWRS
ncbi:transposase [Lignipirellula cremea]|uniref:Insertion element IS402-like domain-containing protein n=1 Tax=Lignipirellula cremea TaxID=2528010 RepID=A0A518DRN9_9BACT|nr:transposase [Lignipirellula cremea]QDU94510.1 hypothetical protein Pla8534_23010 [Lignipirellula cremea]